MGGTPRQARGVAKKLAAWLDVQLAEEEGVRAGSLKPGALVKLKPPLAAAEEIAVAVWCAFGGQVDAAAVNLACELYPIDDRAALLDLVTLIRNRIRK